MKSRPAASASRAKARQSGQLADQRSGTLVAERPDEQLAPNSPIFSALPLYMARRSFIDALGASTAFLPFRDAQNGYRSKLGPRGTDAVERMLSLQFNMILPILFA